MDFQLWHLSRCLFVINCFLFAVHILYSPSAQVVSTNVQQTTTASPVGKPGCGNRPAGVYEIAQGDSLFVIIKKFCVSMTSLLAANNWSSIDVFLFAGMKINIPPAGS